MKKLLQYFIILVIGKVACGVSEIMFITDVHVDYLFDLAQSSLQNFNFTESGSQSQSCYKDPFIETYIGQYGCDPTEKLFEMYFTEIKNEVKASSVKAVVFLGDINPHSGISNYTLKYSTLKNTIYNMANKYFIDVTDSSGNRIPVYMSIGNYDGLINYDPLVVQDYYQSSTYPSFLKGVYLDGSSSLAMGKYDIDRSSYDTIGCYVVKDILGYNNALNNYQSRDIYNNQANITLQWLENILSNSNSNETFILCMHIGPGAVLSGDVAYQWKDSYQILFESIIQTYSSKIQIIFTGHTHAFRMMLPLYSATNSTKSVLGFNLCAFSPISKNNPVYYFASFSNDTGSIQFSDLTIYEVELTQLITRQISLKNIANSAVTLTNSSADVTSTLWPDRVLASLSLFKKPTDVDLTAKQTWLSNYLLRMLGYDSVTTYAKSAWEPRSDISLATPYTSVVQRHQLYCSFITITQAEFTACLADSTWI